MSSWTNYKNQVKSLVDSLEDETEKKLVSDSYALYDLKLTAWQSAQRRQEQAQDELDGAEKKLKRYLRIFNEDVVHQVNNE